jgi:hypothetical protein
MAGYEGVLLAVYTVFSVAAYSSRKIPATQKILDNAGSV